MYLKLCMIVSIITSTEHTKKFPRKKWRILQKSPTWPTVHGLTPSPEYPIVATYGKGSAGKVFNFWWKGEKCVGTLHPCESRFGKNTNLKWISGSPPFISPWNEQTASLHLKCMRGEDEHFPLGLRLPGRWELLLSGSQTFTCRHSAM